MDEETDKEQRKKTQIASSVLCWCSFSFRVIECMTFCKHSLITKIDTKSSKFLKTCTAELAESSSGRQIDR